MSWQCRKLGRKKSQMPSKRLGAGIPTKNVNGFERGEGEGIGRLLGLLGLSEESGIGRIDKYKVAARGVMWYDTHGHERRMQ
jgi:hypothetical protein